MQKPSRFVFALAVAAVCMLGSADALHAKGGTRSSGGSRSSSKSYGSSSKPASKSSGGSFFGGSSSKPKTSSVKPSTPKTGGAFSNNSAKPQSTSSVKPPSSGSGGAFKSTASTPSANSSKPTTTTTAQSKAALQSQSQAKYVATKKATAPPKTSYVSSSGKAVAIKPTMPSVQKVRNLPSEKITPQYRQTATVNHVHTHHYQHDAGWYRSQPSIDVGGGYSSMFFWMMMTDWSAQRRAEWLYHNKDTIERDAYERGMKDAETARLVAQYEADKKARDPNYVDKEFQADPSLMYDDKFVEAAYNPTPQSSGWSSLLFWGFAGAVGLALVCVAYYFVFVYRWAR